MFIALFLLWIIFNGRITLEILLIGLVLSAALTFFCKRVFAPGHTSLLPSPRRVRSAFAYTLALIKEMIVCNLRVMGFILRRKEVQPRLIYFRTKLRHEATRTVLANSITLTPGTITVSVEDDLFCVHSLDASLSETLEDGPLASRLHKMEAE